MRIRNHSVITLIICWSLLLFGSIASANFFEDQFIDSVDGKLDASHWLIKQKGFLPVPTIITEPAVGYGLGMAVMFFHDSIEAIEKQQREASSDTSKDGHRKLRPPSISGVLGMKTENDSWATGAFHFGTWRNDKIRYLGGVFRPSINLKFYGSGDTPIFKDGIDYNIEMWVILQQLMFRIENSNIFLGGRISWFETKNTFELGQPINDIESFELKSDNLGVGFLLQYDSRDNIFTPGHGIDANVSNMYFMNSSQLNDDNEYQVTSAEACFYREFFPKIVFGWRIDGEFSSGRVPFYALPFIDLRGIPAMRYQGQHVLLTEIETRWNFTERWSILGFGGVGRTSDTLKTFGENDNRWAGGVGFRYMIARLLGMHTGIDIAKGPEDWVFYIQAGSAW